MNLIPATDQIDIAYLKSENIGNVIAKGLAAVYKAQPARPVDYLAKWLLSYSKRQVNQKLLDQQMNYKKELKIKQEKQQLDDEELEQLKLDEINLKSAAEQMFQDNIENHQFHERFLMHDFCEFLAQKGMTGVYVGFVDHPTKQISDLEDEELAHLNTQVPKVINYLGANQSHKSIMIGKTIALDQGVTGEVFKPDENGQLHSIYIPNVVNDPRIFYFQWPKLGALLVIPLVYKSCLFEAALDAGLEERLKYQKLVEEQNNNKELKRLEYEEKLRVAQEKEEEPEQINLIHEEWNNFQSELVELKESEFNFQNKEFVVCIDTLGQDKEISKEEREYFEKQVRLFAEKWEKKEIQLLSHDIDFLVNYKKTHNKEQSDEINKNEELYVAEQQNQFDHLKENEKEFEIQSLRLEYLKKQITQKEFYQQFLELKKTRVLKFSGILQALLLFLGFKKKEVNKSGTNILDFELAKHFVNDELFEKIANYTHRGPKPEQIEPYAKIVKIAKRIEKYDVETVEEYNICYGKILKWLKLVLTLRKQDVEIRRQKIEEKRQLREQRIQEFEKMKKDKEKALEEQKNSLQGDELENFDQEGWESIYDKDHPLPDIPAEVADEADEDIEE